MGRALIVAAMALLASNAAWAKTGILICEMSVSEFAEDAAAMKNQLSVNQMAAARQLVDVGRSQCRSSPDIVDANIMSMRAALRLGSLPQTQSATRFDEFWPASREELSELTK